MGQEAEPQDSIRKIEATIVNAKTSEPLGFATVYVNPYVSTIANEEGGFSLSANIADTLHISYVGFKPMKIAVAQTGTVIRMQPGGRVLDEVVVYSPDAIIARTLARLRKEYRRYYNHRASFFFRQLQLADHRSSSLQEAFLSARSAFAVKKMSLITGRYLAHHEKHNNPMNAYRLVQTEVYTNKKEHAAMTPLSKWYRAYYNCTSTAITDGEREFYVLHFTPLDPKEVAVEADVYIDAQTFCVERYTGHFNNWLVRYTQREEIPIPPKGKEWEQETTEQKGGDKNDLLTDIFFERRRLMRVPMMYSFDIFYQHDHKFHEVKTANCHTSFSIEGKPHEVRGTLINVGNYQRTDNKVLNTQGNLRQEIRMQGYDRQFWKNNEVIKRTPLEEEALDLFERENLEGEYEE
ncbi:MAG: carboxypeptidase-like regulatory domain-containing protein [Prevotella sp.]|nr:carboxypeptidase-like regulatory domain-containing protein [Prevotella sp.]